MATATPDELAAEWAQAEETLKTWEKRARESQSSHYECAKYFEGLNYKLGIPVVILSSTVGTTVFATLQKKLDLWIQLAVGAISVLAAILASLQTFLRFGDRAGKHRSTAAQYGSVRRRLEEIQAMSFGSRGALKDFLAEVRTQLDSLAEAAPDVPDRIWKRVVQTLAGKNPKG